ncbi:MAG TPA: GldG family protein, partial [Polyangiaceae bacterium]|nr:GldG family protein [Polyangiaceae bacterium]
DAAIESLVSRLRSPLRVTAYVTTGTPRFDAFVRELTAWLDAFASRSPGTLVVTVIHVDTDAERAEAKAAGLLESAFNDGDGEEPAAGPKGYMGLTFEYGGQKDAVGLLSPDKAYELDFWLLLRLGDLHARAHGLFKKIGLVTGKEELKLTDPDLIPSSGNRPDPSMMKILKEALPIYKIVDVDLRGGGSAIDDTLAGLIITQPGVDYTEAELRRVDQFLMRGGTALAVFASAVNVAASDHSMNAELDARGLPALLEGYGIEMREEAILDWGGSIAIPVSTSSGGEVWYRAPSIVQAEHDSRLDAARQRLDPTSPVFFNMDELSFPFPSTLVPHPEKQPEAVMSVIARTSPKSTVDASKTLSMKIATEWKAKGELAQRAMAIAVEGRLRSAFKGVDPSSGGKWPARSGDDSRVVVISSSQFLANPFVRAGRPPAGSTSGAGGDEMLLELAQPYAQKFITGTVLALKNTLDWMAGGDSSYACAARLRPPKK